MMKPIEPLDVLFPELTLSRFPVSLYSTIRTEFGAITIKPLIATLLTWADLVRMAAKPEDNLVGYIPNEDAAYALASRIYAVKEKLLEGSPSEWSNVIWTELNEALPLLGPDTVVRQELSGVLLPYMGKN